ncbi:FliI/YscN family ATPase [Hydrogenivirga sp.]
MKGVRVYGKVVKVSGIYLEAYNPGSATGDLVEIFPSTGKNIYGEVIGFNEDRCIIMPYGRLSGIKPGDRVLIKSERVSTWTGRVLLGKVVNPFGEPLDGSPVFTTEKLPIELTNINPLERERITEIFDTGVRSVNGMFTLGKGQKVGIFAGAGVGKSTLLGMVTNYSNSDVVVMALIGERGREVREFVEDVLGEGLKKSVVVVSTADEPPVVKVKGALSAIVHARHFASQGLDVLLVMDSITRFAMAQREIGLAAGEPPTLKGYTPSVFHMMTNIVESCGNFRNGGSITGIFSVLVEGDDITLDPVADALVGVFDGHIVLSRKRANAGLFPAIDPVKSLSRLMPKLVSEEHIRMSMYVKELLSSYESMEDLVNLGLYKRGSNPAVDKVLDNKELIDNFFRQDYREGVSFDKSLEELRNLYAALRGESA